MRWTGQPGARPEVVRAASGRRLRENSGRQADLSVISADVCRRRQSAPPYSGESPNRAAFPASSAVLDASPDVAWMEVHTENYMGGGALALLPPELAANLALSIELTTPALLVLGLMTRAAAL